MSPLAGAAPRSARNVLDVSSVVEVQDAVRETATRPGALRIAGAGTWLHAGRPVDAATTLSLRSLRGIVEYVPGDLTITAWAGTSLDELDRTVAEHDQWIALDPFGSRRGTLGATLATASNGPLATSFGTPRDVVLGMQCVTGDGEVVHGGARVVKHVAGFDLVRLMTGAWGTLGVVTQLTLRLRARAPVDATYAVTLGTASLREWFRAYRAASVTALACELLAAPTALSLGVAHDVIALVRLAGNDEAVAAQEAALRDLGAVRSVPSEVWQRFADTDPAEPAAAVRISQRVARIAEVWEEALVLARDLPHARVHATLDRGIARVVLPEISEDDLEHRVAEQTQRAVTRVFEVLPAGLWPRLAASGVVDPLSYRVRAAFDPQRRLNPGILGDA